MNPIFLRQRPRRPGRAAGLFAAVLFGALAGCSHAGHPRPESAQAGAGPRLLTILHTNDHHGHAWPHTSGNCSDVGGLAAQATVVQRLRAAAAESGAAVLLLSAGDVNTGTAPSDALEAAPDLWAMGRIGYDAMVCGNHEFDGPAARYEAQLKAAPFPVLCANVRRGDGSVAGVSHVSFTRNGLRVAVVGVVTGSTTTTSNPALWRGPYTLADPIETAARLGESLRAEHDVLVALVHLGLNADEAAEQASPGARTLARRTTAFDVIVDGHTHTETRQPVREGRSIIVQAGDRGRFVGNVALAVEPGGVRLTHQALVPVNAPAAGETACPTERVPPDPEIARALDAERQRVSADLQQTVATIETPLTGGGNAGRGFETNLGDLVADALRAEAEADVALMNSGGIRGSLPAGPLTLEALWAVLPFRNPLVRVQVSGALLRRVLDHAAALPIGAGGFLQVSGLRFAIAGGRAVDIRVGDAALCDDAQYRLATSSFLIEGGDGYAMLREAGDAVDLGMTCTEAVRRFLGRLATVRYATDGRIERRE